VTQHNQALYRRLLRRFAETQADFASDFRTALAARAQDPDAPTRCAHTLKGVAANIGAEQVREAAAALEAACQEDLDQEATALQALLEQTVAALAPVIAGLQALDESPQPDSASAATAASEPAASTPISGGSSASAPALGSSLDALDPSRLSPLLRRLRDLIEDDDTEAARVSAELATQLKRTKAADALSPVAKALDAYDFEAALAALDQFEASLQ
jgi:polar amino acid transport system substrate-binding protein